MRPAIGSEDIKSAIARTGFPLEHRATEAFRRAKWGVLSSRFYVDDADGRARELDLIAYKVFTSKDKQLEIVTSVLLSCKKDEHNTWALLSRDKHAADKNVDWQPVHFWTDVEPLRTLLESTEWRSSYFAEDARASAFALNVTRDVFAFQQIGPPKEPQRVTRADAKAAPSKGATPQNDTAIFNSVTGLLKALDSEILALPDRMKDRKRVYVFSLAVLVDAPIVEARHSGERCEVREVDELLTLARYMVRRRHFNAQVHFVGADKIEWFIGELDHLVEVNARYFSRKLPEAFKAIETNDAVRSYFSKLLLRKLKFWLNLAIEREGIKDRVTDVHLTHQDGVLKIELDVDQRAIDFLNGHRDTLETTGKTLANFCRYAGSWKFEESIPF